ncbi:cytochrome c oxidase subunit 6b-1 [Amborella trichopoda]|uniref:cytochrome c oxidase subunit 6b-1 n=1 Tax=Amborella trichopoda TaxID=13333 RepID=UPI0005D3F91B|nr:cytochrome c oxidase subunit 6b-1 [Amborella trichopoda]|eukprot:XP_011626531.1 cytochrome c oxidase subunit 6b-1 [Amborella trichopoda]
MAKVEKETAATMTEEKEEQQEKEVSSEASVDENQTDAPEEVSEENNIETAAAEESSGAPEQQESEEQEQEESGEQEDTEQPPVIKIETAPADFRFPTTNQTRHCFTRYIEYHRCIAAKGEGANECDKFAKYYRSLCPGEWIDRWNEQRENGAFPGPL